ncbi:glycosyl hydrolase 115 family protein [Flavivirga aquimarina]|uniref:Glycosyl hydrolase 115 family protein n=1 Tax=Flavivirga aquimarina TaxID=2027862 RepID=A0ABT8WC89_9FLAO|nr:glycosyl hydrolase 115 family protein [Flavivirga aquimarina]MDO5970730.1 glycosyl hydrolase 115 family protein [Flavivirga aquimarina]
MIKILNRKCNYLHVLILSVFIFSACSNNNVINYYLIIGESATNTELSTINDLKNDLSKVVDETIYIISETDKLPENGIFFVVGTPETNKFIKELAVQKKINLSSEIPGSRGGIWSKTTLSNEKEAIVIGGSDVQGFQYAVYDYSQKVLGIDPLEYWTGKTPIKISNTDIYNFEDKTIAPPKVPILCYFENDVDELANYRGKLLEYDWESYTEMINSLVRLRYNAIQFFDMLGRPEFFMRPEYKTLAPNYQLDIDYLEKMIDYAQEKGMKVQIDFALGYQIKSFSEEKAACWKLYKDDWIAAWKYYLEETPLAKTDIFILRSRNQVWDWEYKSSCGEDKIEVFNEVYKVFSDLVDQYKPNAQKVLICYSDGMEMFNEGFDPPKDWIVAWSDHGFGDFKFLPKSTKGHDFGTYMHAGFWLNHTVHNPYPEKVETVMKHMFQNYDADKYCMINGQNFRPFLLNLEAYSAVCNNPDEFTGDRFYKSWTERYFDKKTAKHAVTSMKLLHEAQENRKGYVEHLWEIREAISYLSNAPIRRPGKTPIPYDYKRVENDLESTARCKYYVQKALKEAEIGLENDPLKDTFYHSYIYLPTLLYSNLISFESTLHNMAILKRKFETSNDSKFLEEIKKLIPEARKELETIFKHRASGDLDKKWNNWYSIKIRRQNNGFPTMKMLEDIETNINNLTL